MWANEGIFKRKCGDTYPSPSGQEAKAGGLSQPGLYGHFKASLSYHVTTRFNMVHPELRMMVPAYNFSLSVEAGESIRSSRLTLTVWDNVSKHKKKRWTEWQRKLSVCPRLGSVGIKGMIHGSGFYYCLLCSDGDYIQNPTYPRKELCHLAIVLVQAVWLFWIEASFLGWPQQEAQIGSELGFVL